MELPITRPLASSLTDGRVAKLERAAANDREELVAREMEGLFSQMFVKELRRGLGDGFFGQGAGADTFEGWLDEQLGDSLARDGVLDLVGRIKASFDRTAGREAAQGAEEAPR